MHVLFVCEANRARSPYAALLWRRKLAARGLTHWVTSSAGTFAQPGLAPLPELLRATGTHTAELDQHLSRPLDDDLVSASDLILAMTRSQADHIGSHYDGVVDRLFVLGELAGLLTYAEVSPPPIPGHRVATLDVAWAGSGANGEQRGAVAAPPAPTALTAPPLPRPSATRTTARSASLWGASDPDELLRPSDDGQSEAIERARSTAAAGLVALAAERRILRGLRDDDVPDPAHPRNPMDVSMALIEQHVQTIAKMLLR